MLSISDPANGFTSTQDVHVGARIRAAGDGCRGRREHRELRRTTSLPPSDCNQVNRPGVKALMDVFQRVHRLDRHVDCIARTWGDISVGQMLSCVPEGDPLCGEVSDCVLMLCWVSGVVIGSNGYD